MIKNIFSSEKFNNYWRNIDKNILFCFLTLFFLGIFFSFSSTSSLAGERLNKNFYFFFSKHLLFSTLAIFLMLIISFLDIKMLRKLVIPLFLSSFILLLLVPIIGLEVKGAKRWLDFGLVRLQPIEIIKPFFVLLMANILTKYNNKKSKYSYLLSLFFLLSISVLLLNQPDVGQTILLVITWASIIFISGIKFKINVKIKLDSR